MQIEGRNPVIEALRAKKELTKIFLEKDINVDEKIDEIIRLAKRADIPILYRPKKLLGRISQTGVHQGVIAKRNEDVQTMNMNALIDAIDSTKKDPFLVYVREALYEHNLGAVIRTCECAGADAVLIPPKLTITSQVVRASMGATEHIKIINESLFNAIKIAKKNAIKVIGIEVSGKKFYYENDLTGRVMLIIGGEDHPLSEEITNQCDLVVKIPLHGRVNSLNMSVAASIVIYDKIRQEYQSKIQ